MLFRTLLLLSPPESALTTIPAPFVEPPSLPASQRLADIRESLAAASQAQRDCHNAKVHMIADSSDPVVGDLMYRSRDPARRWLLLERSVNGCSTPISYPHSGVFGPEPHRATTRPVG